MASVGGLSGTTSNSLNSIRGYGGLASGLDRDTLIESMTQGTNSKIYKQQQNKTRLEWEQAAIRGISDKMIAFAEKYLNTFTSSTNLFSDAFWGRNQISVLGANSKFISVSGSSSTADTFSILGVKQMARKAQMVSKEGASDRTLKTGDIDLSEIKNVENLAGKTIDFKVGTKVYSVSLPTGKDDSGFEYKYGTVEEIADSLNHALAAKDPALAKEIKVTADGDKLKFKNVNGNACLITGGSALSYLGLNDDPENFKEIKIDGELETRGITERDIYTKKSFLERIVDKHLTFTYNGVSKTIKMPSKETVDAAIALRDNTPTDSRTDEQVIMDTIKTTMQDELDNAFGKGRVRVDFKEMKNDDGKSVFRLRMKTWNPATNTEDKTSVLSVSSSDADLLGEGGALKMNYGESNRVNLQGKISESGLMGVGGTLPSEIKVNGKSIKVNENDTVIDLMERINGSGAGVEVKYQSESDKFIFTAKANGASGQIEVDEAFNQIFGGGQATENAFAKTDGQDAIISVKYAGSDSTVDLIRDSNSFIVDGMTVSVNGEFGYTTDNNGNKVLDTTSEAITFDAKVNEDKIVDSVKKMVEEFNEIIELVNKETRTKPNRDYQPLTAAQKKEMTEDEIKNWEAKAKEGLLFNDNDLKGLSSGLRYVLSPANLQALQKIGLATSNDYTENGKITFDENKFRAALKSDPEGVKKMFTDKNGVDGNGVSTSTAGIATNMKEVFDRYVKTLGETKGVLIEKAGSTKAPLSITTNAIYKQMQAADKLIAKLQNTLKLEQDRYIKQFTTLESLISQMNSQSSWLSQFGGGY